MSRAWTRSVLIALVLITAACGDDSDGSNPQAPTTVTEREAPDTAPDTQSQEQTEELAAIQTALEFFEARNAWDGPATRALVADEAQVADFAVEAPDDYLAMADLERTLQWQYLDPQCVARASDEVTHVRCSYVMQNRLSQATGTGPYRGSHIEFEISEGLIKTVVNTFEHGLYGPEVLEPFSEWLAANHPGDMDVMFFINESGDVNRSLSPESLALWAERVPEYVAFRGGE